MTERYGPDDTSIPGWEAPSGAPSRSPSQFSPPTPAYPPPLGDAPMAGMPPTQPGIPSTQPRMPTYRSWQPGFMPLRPLSLGDFLSLPMKAITANRQVILGGPLLCVIASFLAAILPIVLIANEQQHFFRYYPTADWGPMGGETILSIVFALLVLFVIDLAARALVVPGVSRAILGERLPLGQAWSIARSRIPQLLLLYLLSFVGLIGVGIAVWLLGILSAGILLIPILLAAIPAALLAVPLMGIAVSALVLEQLSAGAALRRAFSLVKGSAWRLIGNFLVIYIVLYIVTGAISAMAQVVLFGVGTSSVSVATFTIVSIVMSVIVTVASSMIGYSFLGSLFTLMYVDLRIRNEGFDVDLARAAEAAAGR